MRNGLVIIQLDRILRYTPKKKGNKNFLISDKLMISKTFGTVRI